MRIREFNQSRKSCATIRRLVKGTMTGKKEIRGYIPIELIRLVKMLAAIRDENVSDAMAEALTEWTQKPENQELIKKHNLKDD